MKTFDVPLFYRSPLIAAVKKKRKELDRMKSDFVSHVSHELRTPLQIISGHVELLDLDDDPATRFNNIEFGNNTFRHFTHDVTDWAGTVIVALGS